MAGMPSFAGRTGTITAPLEIHDNSRLQGSRERNSWMRSSSHKCTALERQLLASHRYIFRKCRRDGPNHDTEARPLFSLAGIRIDRILAFAGYISI